MSKQSGQSASQEPAVPTASSPFASIEAVLDELRRGRMVVICDDEDRENEGDLCLPAQFVTPQHINFMLREASGYLFVSLPSADCDRLDLHGQCPENTAARGTPLTVTIDGHPRHGFTTGVSVSERCRTIQMAIDPESQPDDFVRPGHINPLRSRDGGVLVRNGHTEAMVDLCRLAGLRPAAVGIEICRADGEMARVPDLIPFCEKHGLLMCTIADLIAYRLRTECLIRRLGPSVGVPFETEYGRFTLLTYQSAFDAMPHYVLTLGGVGERDARGVVDVTDDPVLVRVHRSSLFQDSLHQLASDKKRLSRGHLLDASMRRIASEGRGAVVVLQQSAEGHLPLPAWNTDATLAWDPDSAAGPPDAAPGRQELERRIGIGCQILLDLGIRRMRLMTTREREIPGLGGFGLSITEFVTDH